MIEKICDEIGVEPEQLMIKQLQQQCKKQKEAIDKAIEYISTMYIPQDVISQKQELLDILKEMLE